MKDLSYLQAFSPKALRVARMILCKGFTVDDIDEFIEKQIFGNKSKHTRKIPKDRRKEFLENVKWGNRKP